ncbi:MAG: hypothetical protein RL038_1126 [Actinomycetota bacterium]|jgi:quinol monooxygenase YgiN
MENLMAVAIFPSIPEENLAEFKAIAQQMLISLKEMDSVLRYEIFFSLDGTRCVVLEEYSTPAGVFDHVRKHTEYLEQLTQLGGQIEGSVFPLSSEGQEIQEIRDHWDSTMHTYFAGKR